MGQGNGSTEEPGTTTQSVRAAAPGPASGSPLDPMDEPQLAAGYMSAVATTPLSRGKANARLLRCSAVVVEKTIDDSSQVDLVAMVEDLIRQLALETIKPGDHTPIDTIKPGDQAPMNTIRPGYHTLMKAIKVGSDSGLKDITPVRDAPSKSLRRSGGSRALDVCPEQVEDLVRDNHEQMAEVLKLALQSSADGHQLHDTTAKEVIRKAAEQAVEALKGLIHNIAGEDQEQHRPQIQVFMGTPVLQHQESPCSSPQPALSTPTPPQQLPASQLPLSHIPNTPPNQALIAEPAHLLTTIPTQGCAAPVQMQAPGALPRTAVLPGAATPPHSTVTPTAAPPPVSCSPSPLMADTLNLFERPRHHITGTQQMPHTSGTLPAVSEQSALKPPAAALSSVSVAASCSTSMPRTAATAFRVRGEVAGALHEEMEMSRREMRRIEGGMAPSNVIHTGPSSSRPRKKLASNGSCLRVRAGLGPRQMSNKSSRSATMNSFLRKVVQCDDQLLEEVESFGAERNRGQQGCSSGGATDEREVEQFGSSRIWGLVDDVNPDAEAAAGSWMREHGQQSLVPLGSGPARKRESPHVVSMMELTTGSEAAGLQGSVGITRPAPHASSAVLQGDGSERREGKGFVFESLSARLQGEGSERAERDHQPQHNQGLMPALQDAHVAATTGTSTAALDANAAPCALRNQADLAGSQRRQSENAARAAGSPQLMNQLAAAAGAVDSNIPASRDTSESLTTQSHDSAPTATHLSTTHTHATRDPCTSPFQFGPPVPGDAALVSRRDRFPSMDAAQLQPPPGAAPPCAAPRTEPQISPFIANPLPFSAADLQQLQPGPMLWQGLHLGHGRVEPGHNPVQLQPGPLLWQGVNVGNGGFEPGHPRGWEATHQVQGVQPDRVEPRPGVPNQEIEGAEGAGDAKGARVVELQTPSTTLSTALGKHAADAERLLLRCDSISSEGGRLKPIPRRRTTLPSSLPAGKCLRAAKYSNRVGKWVVQGHLAGHRVHSKHVPIQLSSSSGKLVACEQFVTALDGNKWIQWAVCGERLTIQPEPHGELSHMVEGLDGLTWLGFTDGEVRVKHPRDKTLKYGAFRNCGVSVMAAGHAGEVWIGGENGELLVAHVPASRQEVVTVVCNRQGFIPKDGQEQTAATSSCGNVTTIDCGYVSVMLKWPSSQVSAPVDQPVTVILPIGRTYAVVAKGRSSDGCLELWQSERSEKALKDSISLSAYGPCTCATSVDWKARDKGRLVTGHSRGAVLLWDDHTRGRLTPLVKIGKSVGCGGIRGLAFLPELGVLCAGCYRGIRVCQLPLPIDLENLLSEREDKMVVEWGGPVTAHVFAHNSGVSQLCRLKDDVVTLSAATKRVRLWPSSSILEVMNREGMHREANVPPELMRELRTQHLVMKAEDVKTISKVDSGSFGVVKLAKWKGILVATKEAKEYSSSLGTDHWYKGCSGQDWPEQLKELLREVRYLADLNHPNVARLLGVVLCPETQLCKKIVMQYHQQGNVMKLINKAAANRVSLSWLKRLTMLIDVASGMVYLHSLEPAPLIHGDLRSPNLLLDVGDVVKIADFGSSRRLLENSGASNGERLNPRWCAPEKLETNEDTKATDVYSFGIIMWELLTLKLPFSDHDPTPELGQVQKDPHDFWLEGFIKEGGRPPLPKEGSPVDYIPLMQACWDQDPTRRPCFPDIQERLKGMYVAEYNGTGETAGLYRQSGFVTKDSCR